MTPRANVLEGITRRTVFDLARELAVPVREADLLPDALREAGWLGTAVKDLLG